jgi:two-component system, chemotaxis family, sensor kinase CheA
MKTAARSYFGKYREIIWAVALFLVLDLSVLILNFYISYQISEDALSINLAGRQRMLSQRITKSLLIAQANINQDLPVDGALAELKVTTKLFDETLTAFEQGGTAQGGDKKRVRLAAIISTDGIEILSKARAIWEPYLARVGSLVKDGNSSNTVYLVDGAVRFALANNLQLLDLMNQLTTTLEQGANAKADTLRIIQTVGILLAMLNFVFILFKFIRRLRENDRKIEIAQNETGEILATVKEGLFLLDEKLLIGSQFSASLEKMLGVPVRAGSDFREVMRTIFTRTVFDNACDFIELLFSAHIKEGLLGDLNPLNKVEITIQNGQGIDEKRYLTLSFNRVVAGGKTLHLLVTMFDVTNEVELERALVDAKEEARLEMEGLLDLLKIEPSTLHTFLTQSEQNLHIINEDLRGAGAEIDYRPLDYRRTVDAVFRRIHSFKGDAAVLGLDVFENLAQNFESSLSVLRNKPSLSGEDLLALPFYLEEILQRVDAVKNLLSRLASYYDTFSPLIDADSFAAHLESLVSRIAKDYGKQVKLITDLRLISAMPPHTSNELKEIVVQLLRNAVTHGIEPVAERIDIGKQANGSIHIALTESTHGEYELVLRDDGRGLVPDNIRITLLRSGRYTAEQLNEFSDKQILMKIFEPGFSTATQVDRNAGHGVGLDVVHKKIEQLGARLRIATHQSTYTQFSIIFPA